MFVIDRRWELPQGPGVSLKVDVSKHSAYSFYQFDSRMRRNWGTHTQTDRDRERHMRVVVCAWGGRERERERHGS